MSTKAITVLVCVLVAAAGSLFFMPLIYRSDGTLIRQELSPCCWCGRDNVVEVDDMAFVCKACGYVSTVKIKPEGR